MSYLRKRPTKLPAITRRSHPAYIVLGTLNDRLSAHVGLTGKLDETIGVIMLADMGHLKKEITVALRNILSFGPTEGFEPKLERLLEVEIVKCLGYNLQSF
jgi:hypothetical protein